jgi:hypothetical protein
MFVPSGLDLLQIVVTIESLFALASLGLEFGAQFHFELLWLNVLYCTKKNPSAILQASNDTRSFPYW